MSTDTLTVLSTLGTNEALYIEAVTHLFAFAQVPTDLFVSLDEGTEAQVQSLLSRGNATVPSVSVDASPKRRGLVESYNAGFRYFLARPQYKYLHLLEEGVRVLKGWDMALRSTLDAHPDFGWVACGQVHNPGAPFTALCSLLTREAVEKVKGLDPLFAPDQFDDGDLFMRLRDFGYWPQAVPFRVLHPRSRTSRNGTQQEDYDRMLAHQQLFADRHGIPDMPWASVPVHPGDCAACATAVGSG